MTAWLLSALLFACGAEVRADDHVEVGGRVLRIEATGDGIKVEGLPAITRVRDEARRLVEIRADGRPLLTYRRSADGRLRGVIVNGSAELLVETLGDHLQSTLRTSGGRVLHSSLVAAAYGTRVPDLLRLDLLRDARIAPQEQWSVSRDGTRITVTDRECRPLYYAVVHGPDKVVFDRHGRAVLYDLDLLGAIDQGPGSGVFFSRLMLAANGDVEALAPFAPAGAVLAVRIADGEIAFDSI